MITIQRSALVEFSAQQMFDLVNDIEQYPQFLPGCRSARVVSQTAQEMVGQLCLARAGLSHTFTTRNTLVEPTTIEMALEEGGFSHFAARWEFTPLTDSACKVSLEMAFEFKPGLLDLAMEKLFSSTANNMVAAMVERAQQLYD